MPDIITNSPYNTVWFQIPEVSRSGKGSFKIPKDVEGTVINGLLRSAGNCWMCSEMIGGLRRNPDGYHITLSGGWADFQDHLEQLAGREFTEDETSAYEWG